MLGDVPDDDSSESKEEEIIRRDTCAAAFVGKPPLLTLFSLVLTIILSGR
jgi:hypothetical protein